MTTVHLDRKALKKPDTFTDRLSKLFLTLQKNTKLLLGIVALAFVVSVSIVGYSKMKEKKELKASTLFFSASKELETQLGATKATKSADGKATITPEPTNANWEDSARDAMQRLESVETTYPGTFAAYASTIQLANTYFDHNNPEKAALYFKKASEQTSDRLLKATALNGLAYSFEQQKKYDQAIETIHTILSLGATAIEQDARLNLARNYALKGDNAAATEQFDKLIKDFPNSPIAKTAKSQKATLTN